MAALEADADGVRGGVGACWTLPDWEEYSDRASSSFAGDWSDVEADVSLDTASSVASTEHQRVYRIQRVRGEPPRDLRDIHSLYTQRRLDESSQGVGSSAKWLRPPPCASPRVPEEKPQGQKLVEKELLAQQSEISAELQAVRKQLSEFQDKWKNTVDSRADADTSGAPTVASPWSSPLSKDRERHVAGQTVAVQTERDEREDAVKQWVLLLTQKLTTLTRKYAHEPTHSFQAAMTHLAGLQSFDKDGSGGLKESAAGSEEGDDATSLASWHVGRALKTAVPLEIAEQFLELEHAIACMSTAVEQHERRQMSNLDRAVQQVQGYHHERMQQVVDESLAELKLVRGRYKKKEAQLEDELRAANKEIEQWKQTAAEAEHRKKLDRETLEFKLSSAKELYDQACRRYENDVAQFKTQLETVRAERKQVISQHKDTHEVIEQAKEGAIALERQCQALKKQQERAEELHDREVRVLQDSIRQLREGSDELEVQHAKEKHILADTLKKLEASQQTGKQELEARMRDEVTQQVLDEVLPKTISDLKKHHEDAVSTMESEHKRQLANLAEQPDKKKRTAPPSVRAIETQTDPPTAQEDAAERSTQVKDDNQAQEQIEELTHRCRALKKLLDKKFEDTPSSLSSSRRCDSCHSDDDISTSSAYHGSQRRLNTSRSSSIHSDASYRPRVSGKSRALARALLGSSRAYSISSAYSDNKAPPFMNETTLATDEATLGAHEMWDSASFTSIDTADGVPSFASQRSTPRQRMRSTQDILTLVRQIKHAAAPLDNRREPDPEMNWETNHHKHAMSASRSTPPSASKHLDKWTTATSVRTSTTTGPSVFDDLLC
ncbi:hypothetical protein PF008_g10866 [Phytophthora fragariae]|uniref:Uncharacterized protein n=1 Tax=Phytophthora fragariae TaxID=53985 RepID=A0A6G0RSN9_9STRA|nr:hypothetical protein PF008_g10866 [Phytophthora fragariae]